MPAAAPGAGPLPIHRAIEDALQDGRDAYEERGILLVRALEARRRVRAPEPAVYQAVYAVFRALPARLPPGAALYISTFDRPDGDVELAWEARERPRGGDPAAKHPRAVLRAGPHGDLLELALLGLEAICRAEGGLREVGREPDAPGSTSSVAHEIAGHVRRRYAFVLPADDAGAPG